MKAECAELAAYSSWNLEDWDKLDFYVKFINEETQAYEKQFYQAILSIKNQKYDKAVKFIDKCRHLID